MGHLSLIENWNFEVELSWRTKNIGNLCLKMKHLVLIKPFITFNIFSIFFTERPSPDNNAKSAPRGLFESYLGDWFSIKWQWINSIFSSSTRTRYSEEPEISMNFYLHRKIWNYLYWVFLNFKTSKPQKIWTSFLKKKWYLTDERKLK